MADDPNQQLPPTRFAQTERKLRCTRRLLGLTVILLAVAVGVDVRIVRRAQSASARARLEHAFWVVGHASFSPQKRTAAFLELVAAGNGEWRGAHLDGLKLDGASLPGANLMEADFKNSVFTGAQLAKAILAKTRLELADLSEADLTGADLSGALLLRAKLQRAQLNHANLRGTALEQVEAQNTALLMANLADAYLLMANLSGAKLGGADLSGAHLEAAILKGADLSLTRLNNTNLKDTDFTHCNWWRARGLSVPQIEWLQQKFQPDEKWPVALREDYQEWASRRDADTASQGVSGGSR